MQSSVVVHKGFSINKDIVKGYLSNSFYDFSKKTFYEDICQVKQGTYMVFDIKKNSYEEKQYWNLKSKKTIRKFDVVTQRFKFDDSY